MDNFNEKESVDNSKDKTRGWCWLRRRLDAQFGKLKKKTHVKYETMFEILPLVEDKRKKSKWKTCDTVYLCDSSNGTGNLRRHTMNNAQRVTRDLGQHC